MPITVRLPAEIESKLNKVASLQKKTKSVIIKESLELYLEKFFKSKTPFELGKGLFGKHGSGIGNLSIKSEIILREKLSAKKHT